MSFSWWCKDKDGKDLFKEFGINGQALGLGDARAPIPVDTIRSRYEAIPYKEKLEDAARDALAEAQSLVLKNLESYETPQHPECPTCQCRKPLPSNDFWGMDIEQAKRFVSIPLERVWRAGGG